MSPTTRGARRSPNVLVSTTWLFEQTIFISGGGKTGVIIDQKVNKSILHAATFLDGEM